MRVRGGCAILWRQQGVSQIGTSPAQRTIVSGLSLAEQRLLDEFTQAEQEQLKDLLTRARELLRTQHKRPPTP